MDMFTVVLPQDLYPINRGILITLILYISLQERKKMHGVCIIACTVHRVDSWQFPLLRIDEN